MMIDRYTKGALTVIAVALVVLASQNGMRMAKALDYNDACGTATHPPCQVTWSRSMPVRVEQ
jgi:hypothetical protein